MSALPFPFAAAVKSEKTFQSAIPTARSAGKSDEQIRELASARHAKRADLALA
jgi:hypothetical protein